MNLLYSALTIGGVLVALGFGFSQLPTAGTLPDGLTTGITLLVTYMTAWGYFLDFETLFTVVGLTLTIEFFILIYKVLMMILGFVLRRGT